MSEKSEAEGDEMYFVMWGLRGNQVNDHKLFTTNSKLTGIVWAMPWQRRPVVR
jgi:hypothetical protein